ncbi:DUF2515 family protein, partial [Jannaschia sp. LMIT008]|uniref:DUF2515 family protein n=1 Tax=Jannaschia maritima TaxID=3032585 RepID=UPI002810B9BC
MNDFSTTQAPDAPVSRCPSNCAEAMDMVMEDVNDITRIGPAIDRNAAITRAYRQLGCDMPNNHWVRLAGYVSVQGGCAMQRVQSGTIAAAAFPPAELIGRLFVDGSPGEGLVASMDALRDANTEIFTSVYPPNKFMHECGYERLKECVDAGEIQVDGDLMDALGKLDDG